jgi:heme exporter protein B
VTVIFASILGLNRSMAIEREQDNMNAMLIAPIDRSAIYMGKFIGNLMVALVVGFLLLPLMTVLYNINLIQPWLIVVLVLGTVGISATGTLLAGMTVQTRAREALLPIAMLPVVLPLLLAAVNACAGIISDAPFSDWSTWPQVLLVVDIIYVVMCFLAFGYVMEE